MLTVACVLRTGGVYTPEWVARLRAGVKRHLKASHKFVCMSDVDVPCERIPLRHDWPGWWAKMELWRIHGPVLYLDLDTAIVGDLSAVAEHAAYTAGFTMLRDFYAADHCGSGVMAWNGDYRRLYDDFAVDAAHLMKVQRARMGDQALIEDVIGRENIMRWQDHVPGIVSYKVHCGRSIPEGTCIVALHGRPKFADMPVNDPVRLAWEAV